ncbi:galactose-1-phosphate uridylyltransferase [Orenia marismortui]|uniref:Galactose-1-phosphate uridylyltransferase n=1 Tax=Orenia marismortui TaxID=46469 RepID=A0A4R8GYC6_9FIRM|nr:galactose-1-phosphate uridylyltransferase [Orenia marismortui]TDX51419.1 UDPglucose--hexose-1-phosphate uridylyltransferase [Orenia marismortui]
MSEIRKDLLRGEDVIVATSRGKRPNDFDNNQKFNRACPFCNGNKEDDPLAILSIADSDKQSGNHWKIRVVPNKFPILDRVGEFVEQSQGFFQKIKGVGVAEVVIESNKHQGSLSDYSINHIIDLIKVLKQRYNDLASDNELKYLQIFKNSGEKSGASLEHPHWQIIATPIIPSKIKQELKKVESYYTDHHSCIYCDLIESELVANKRIISEDENFVSFIPYAAHFAYETWIMPKGHSSSFANIKDNEIQALAKILRKIMRKFKRYFNDLSFNIIIHTVPFNKNKEYFYHWYLKVIPRLSICGGFELGTGMSVTTTSPEVAAKRLREVKVD